MKINHLDIRTVRTLNEGDLSYLEAMRDIPFEIKRVYYTYGVPSGVKRGRHAHRSLKQILFCPFGEIEIILDDGVERQSVTLDDATKGLVIGDMIWHEMVWKIEGSVLVVGASDYYDEADYIRDYEEFLNAVND